MIDAHQHYWRLGHNDCAWPTPELASIYRDFGPEDLEPLACALGISGSILVQSQASDKDTDFLLELARERDFIKAVVGWVDLSAPAAASRIAELAKQPKLRGLRPMLQAERDDDWILQPALHPAFDSMIAHRLSFDALVYTRHLPALLRFAQRYPKLAMVIDHGAKPPIAGSDPAQDAQWYAHMAELAALPWVYCKISGLVNEAAAGQGAAVYRRYIQQLLDLFGPSRLMWGSDWPVLNAAPEPSLAQYGSWLALAWEALAHLPTADSEAIFAATARDFYRV